MISIKRTDSTNGDFQSLIVSLDLELTNRYGEQQAFFAQFNKVNKINHVVVGYLNDIPVGCGAIKEYSNDTMEVKRMFVKTDSRGKGIAGRILEELEKWTKESGYSNCILETGIKQPEAIRLYEKAGYRRIPNYGQYEGIEASVCMKKKV